MPFNNYINVCGWYKFFRKLNHVDPSPSPIEAIKDNPQKIVSTNEYEKITALTKKYDKG